MARHEGSGEDPPRVRLYEMVLEDDGRLNEFDLEEVMRTLLLRFNFRLVSIRPYVTEINETPIHTLTPEDDAEIIEMLQAANPFREVVSICTECGATRREIFHGAQRVSIHTNVTRADCVDHDWLESP